MALSSSRPLARPDAADAAQGDEQLPVLLVSSEGALWRQLAAVAAGLETHQFDTVDELIGEWDAGRAAVVLIDTRTETDLAATVQRVLNHGSSLVAVALIAAAPHAAAAVLERRQTLFGQLVLPLDPESARSLIGRAVEEAMARCMLVVGDGAQAADGEPPRRAPRRPAPLLLTAAAVAALIAVAGAAWWSLRPGATPAQVATPAHVATPAAPARSPVAAAPPAVTLPPPSGAAVPVERVEALLAQARAALRDKRYIDPASDNALAQFRGVLDLDPANGEARQGIERVAELLLARADAALAGHDYRGALRALEVARSLKPDHPRLAALDAQVSQHQQELTQAQIQAALQAGAFARAAALIRQAERAGTVEPAQLAQLRQDAAQREATARSGELLRTAQARIAQGRLLEPADDNAKLLIAQLAAQGEAVPADELARLRDAYLRRAGTEAHAAIGRGAFAEAEPLLAELRSGGAATASTLQRELDKARQQQAQGAERQRLAELVEARIAGHALLAPEGDSALSYYRALMSAEPRNATLPTLRESLGGALLEQARAAFAAGRATEAQAALDAAGELGIEATALAAARAAGGASLAQVIAKPPKMRGALRLDYPREAAQAGLEGWVEVEFLVNARGAAEQVHVVRAEPAGAFESAALAAVRHANFEPAQAADGTPVAMRSSLRVRFALQKSP